MSDEQYDTSHHPVATPTSLPMKTNVSVGPPGPGKDNGLQVVKQAVGGRIRSLAIVQDEVALLTNENSRHLGSGNCHSVSPL